MALGWYRNKEDECIREMHGGTYTDLVRSLVREQYNSQEHSKMKRAIKHR
jgi:hypothetical protein